jgi:hypothetical protein
MIRNTNSEFGESVYFQDTAEMATILNEVGFRKPDGGSYAPEDLVEGRDYERVKIKLLNLLTREIVAVRPSTDSPDSSYGLPCWIDDKGNSYGQCQFGAPLGYDIIVEAVAKCGSK